MGPNLFIEYFKSSVDQQNRVEKYQRTPAAPHALEVRKEAYTQLDQPDLAQDVACVYDLNFPNGPPVPKHKDATFSHQVWDFIGLE